MLSEKQTTLLELIVTFKHIYSLSVSIITYFLNRTKYKICLVPHVLNFRKQIKNMRLLEKNIVAFRLSDLIPPQQLSDTDSSGTERNSCEPTRLKIGDKFSGCCNITDARILLKLLGGCISDNARLKCISVHVCEHWRIFFEKINAAGGTDWNPFSDTETLECLSDTKITLVVFRFSILMSSMQRSLWCCWYLQGAGTLQIFPGKTPSVFTGASVMKLLTCGLGGALKLPPVCTWHTATDFLTCDNNNHESTLLLDYS